MSLNIVLQSRPMLSPGCRAVSIFLGALLLVLGGCGTGEPTVDEVSTVPADFTELEEPETGEETGEPAADEDPADLFDQTRSRLQDQFNRFEHSIPELLEMEIEEEERDPYQGYRIQILSTRDVDLADSTRARFDSWASENLGGYHPHSYIHFRQPFYRVRIGDLHDRNRAIELSRLVKPHFPDAWIIHDRIHPHRVPADTLEFRMAEPGERDFLLPEPPADEEDLPYPDEETSPVPEERSAPPES